MGLKMLYIAEDWYGTSVHHNLLNTLMCNHSFNFRKIYLFCLDRGNLLDISSSYYKPRYEIIRLKNTSNSRRYKYDFQYKKNYKFNVLLNAFNADFLAQIDIVHASTLFSEGAVAYMLFLKYKTPYIISIRGTDINMYLNKMFHLWPLAKRIIENASSVVFLSPSLLNNYHNSLFYKLFSPMNNSIHVIPNGIDEKYFRSSEFVCGDTNKNSNKYLYIGRFDKNKNVIHLISAFKEYLKDHPTACLTLIGGGGNNHDKVLHLIQDCPNIIFLGEIRDKQILQKCFSEHSSFVMVSHSETFGLVYVEALLNGLPIIYTKNQGIDGLIPKSFGISVDSHSLTDLISAFSKVEKCSVDLKVFDFNKFHWSSVAKRYYELYVDISLKRNLNII